MTKEIAVKETKIDQLEVFFPPYDESCRLLIGCSHSDYSASRIAHAVEDANAQLLNLNVTSLEVDGCQIIVALRINHRNPELVARSLERYGYNVISFETNNENDDVIQARYDELMHYLSM